MTTYRVTAPVPGYTGDVGAISFAKGAAFVSDADNGPALQYFRAQGYMVEDVADLPAAESGGAADAARVVELEARVAELEAQIAAAAPADSAATPVTDPEPTPEAAPVAAKTSGTAAKGATK
jgi:hypothetical protein